MDNQLLVPHKWPIEDQVHAFWLSPEHIQFRVGPLRGQKNAKGARTIQCTPDELRALVVKLTAFLDAGPPAQMPENGAIVL